MPFHHAPVVSTTSASPPRDAAGVLVHDGAGHVLLGLQRGGWSSFSGKSEAWDATPRDTALRECDEETLYVLHDAVRACVPADPTLVSHTPSGKVFRLFEARIPMDRSVEQRFECVRRSGAHARAVGCGETRRVRWFHVHELGGVKLRRSLANDLHRLVALVGGASGGEPNDRR